MSVCVLPHMVIKQISKVLDNNIVMMGNNGPCPSVIISMKTLIDDEESRSGRKLKIIIPIRDVIPHLITTPIGI